MLEFLVSTMKKVKRVSDLISRQAVIDSFEAYAEMLRIVLDNTDIVGNERKKFAWGLELIESFISDMKELPSAEPERKKGKWIKIEPQKKGKWMEIKYAFRHKCSNCEWINNADSGYNFCPNCGADMKRKL